MNRRKFLQAASNTLATSPLLARAASGETVDLRQAVIVIPEKAAARERKPASVLAEEVQKRTGLRWPIQSSAASTSSSISLKTKRAADGDSYAIEVNGSAISIAGASERGLLFGVGALLRKAVFGRQTAEINPKLIAGTSTPKYPVRGHQLGYRPKTNAYDAWDVRTWDQYIRDLAMFGTNAIELIPPRSDDEADSPHFPLPPEQMMIEMSRICDEYGLDVWIWYPAMDPDYADAATVEAALKEWAHFFQVLPRIDAVFVPGGDPGHTEPRAMLSFLDKQKASLRRFHPKAQMWMSPQGFNQAWMDDFFHLTAESHTATWLDGVVFGPQSRLGLPDFRKRLPKRYPIRFYPDITHSVECQYPVPDWDVAYAVTEGREVINPRPQDQANILRRYSPDTIGFITYSEGCNDDVNKFVWSALGWNPEMQVMDALRDFGRYFFGQPYAEGMAQGLQNLEYNWRGPLSTNAGVSVTLARFRDLERSATPSLIENWRFQQALYRAYYDASVQSRLLSETGAMRRATDLLARVEEIGWAAQPLNIGQAPGPAPANGLDPAVLLDQAQQILDNAMLEPAGLALRTRTRELGEALMQSIRMQLAVGRYRGEAVNRAANLETLETPVTDVAWLRAQIQEIKKRPAANEQVVAIRNLLARTDPGPGGFYDEPGNPSNRPHVISGPGCVEDPEFRRSLLTGFNYPDRLGSAVPLAWKRWGETLFDAPFQMQYRELDAEARYKVRVVYSGEARKVKIRLTANGGHEVHGFLDRPVPQRALEFDIPAEATATGELMLSWTREQGLGGNGRGCQVCEVWLMRK